MRDHLLRDEWNSRKHLAAWLLFGLFFVSFAFVYAAMVYCFVAGELQAKLEGAIFYWSMEFGKDAPTIKPELGLQFQHVGQSLVVAYLLFLTGTVVAGVVALSVPSLPGLTRRLWHDDVTDSMRPRTRGRARGLNEGLWRAFWLFSLAAILAWAWMLHAMVSDSLSTWHRSEIGAVIESLELPGLMRHADWVVGFATNGAELLHYWFVISALALASYVTILVWHLSDGPERRERAREVAFERPPRGH